MYEIFFSKQAKKFLVKIDTISKASYFINLIKSTSCIIIKIFIK